MRIRFDSHSPFCCFLSRSSGSCTEPSPCHKPLCSTAAVGSSTPRRGCSTPQPCSTRSTVPSPRHRGGDQAGATRSRGPVTTPTPTHPTRGGPLEPAVKHLASVLYVPSIGS